MALRQHSCYNRPVPHPDDLHRTVEEIEAAWMAYRADIQHQVEAGTLPETEGKALRSERHKAAWMRQYLLTRCGMKC